VNYDSLRDLFLDGLLNSSIENNTLVGFVSQILIYTTPVTSTLIGGATLSPVLRLCKRSNSLCALRFAPVGSAFHALAKIFPTETRDFPTEFSDDTIGIPVEPS
jgi:hypothetical protein